MSGRIDSEIPEDEELIVISQNDILDAIASQVSLKPEKEHLSPPKPQKLEPLS